MPFFFMAGDKKIRMDDSVADTVLRSSRTVTFPLTDALDLHPFQPKDIPSVVEEYLEQCAQAGYRQVRLIHGKGKGCQRKIVRSLLSKTSRRRFISWTRRLRSAAGARR